MLFKQILRVRAPGAKFPVRINAIGTRHFSFKPEDQPRIRIGSTAPNFTVNTTEGKIDFHQYIGNDWLVLFSHPADYTPVCTTELGAFSKLKPEFDKRGVKLLGLSTEGVESHNNWVKDIEEVVTEGEKFGFPIIADTEREVAFKYDMVSEADFNNLEDLSKMVGTVRSVFVIDPAKKVRLIFAYPASTGRNTTEVLRVVDALQLADREGVATPIDWKVGQDVIIPPSVSDEDAKAKFGEFKTLKSYLRTTSIKQ